MIYRWILLTTLAFALFATSVGSPYLLVTSEASCRAGKPLATYLSGAEVDQYATVGVVDLCADSATSNINDMFSTNFKGDNAGIAMEISKDKAVLLSKFDSMFSVDFCGCKAAEYYGLVTDSLCVVLPEIDLEETLDAHDQFFRRILAKLSVRDSSEQRVPLVFLVKSSNSVQQSIVDRITNFVESIWTDVNSQDDLNSIADVIVTNVGSDVSKLSSLNPTITREKFVEMISSAAKHVSAGIPKAFLKPNQRSALYVIEKAYTKCLLNSEVAMQRWTMRVNEGKVVGKFGERIEQLIASTQKSFYSETRGSLLVRERASRAEQLSTAILSTASTLFKQQLTILQNDASESLKKSLIKLARTHNEIPPEEEQQAMRTAYGEFEIDAGEIEAKALGLDGAEAKEEARSNLKSVLEEFAESPGAKLEAVRKFDNKSKQSQRKKERGVNIGLNLVGMLRPPGNGGLQGFIGYSTGLFGLPLDLLLGVHNDGDSPEIIGDDREYPILRLQPKVSFDVSV